MSIASRLSLGMSDKDKEWINNIILPIENLQPGSPGFDSGISGVSLDSDHQNTEQRLDGEMDFLFNPFSAKSEETSVGTEKNYGNGNNSLCPDFDMLVGSPSPPATPWHDLSNGSNLLLYGDAASDDFIDMFNNSTDHHQPIASSSFDCGVGNFPISNSYNTTGAINTNNQSCSNKASTSTAATTINHFGFSQNNTGNQIENPITINPPRGSDGKNDLMRNINNMDEEDMDDTKQKSRLIRKKNAEMARANRQKKKNHLQELETKVQKLAKLEEENKQLLSDMKHKDRHINYLENVLANHSALSQVLEYVPVKKKILLSSEFNPDDHWSRLSTQNFGQNDEHSNNNNNNRSHAAGICLHFKPNNHISLELCMKCSQSSQMTFNQNQDQFYQNEEFSNS